MCFSHHPPFPSMACKLLTGSDEHSILRRYWPGKAPDWYQGEPDEDLSDVSEDDEAEVTAVAPPVIVKAAEDPRLRRLAEVCHSLLPFHLRPPHIIMWPST